MTGFLPVFLQTSLILAFTTLLLPCNGQAYVQDAVCQPLAPEKNNRIRSSLAGSYCLKPNLEIQSRNRLLPDDAAGLPSQAVANHRDNVILDLQSHTVRAGDVSLGIRIENTGPTNYVPDHQGFAQSLFSSSNACIRLSDRHSQGWSVRVEGPGTYCLAEDLNQSAPPAWMRLPHMAVPYDPLVAVVRGAAGNIMIDLAGRRLVTSMESGQGMMHLGGAAWTDGELYQWKYKATNPDDSTRDIDLEQGGADQYNANIGETNRQKNLCDANGNLLKPEDYSRTILPTNNCQ